MFKRVVALLLLPTVLLTQWASVGRCHGCRQVADHDRNPHVHLTGWLFTASTPQIREQHQGKPGCCHHHGEEQGDDQDSSDEQGSTPVQHQHDTTGYQGGGIVYLPSSLIHGWLTGRSPTCSDNVAHTPFLALCENLLIQVQPLLCTHSPPSFFAVADSQASVRTLPLLI